MTTCIPDLAIVEQISSILARDVRINDHDIHVSIDDGWVFLDGQCRLSSRPGAGSVPD